MTQLCWITIAFALLVYESISYQWDKQTIYITKHGKYQRLSDGTQPDGNYVQITGENSGRGEISYFTGYSRRSTESWNSDEFFWDENSCEFDREMFIYKSWNTWVLNDQQPEGFSQTRTSVFVSKQQCEELKTVQIYHAMCRDSKQKYGRVGTSRGLCGRDRTHYEHHFFAFVGKPMCKTLTRSPNCDMIPKYDSPRGIVEYTYKAQWGYQVKGPKSIYCLDSGKWNSSPSKCSPITCRSSLSRPSNGGLSTTENTYGTSVTYVCNPGYQQDPAGGSISCLGSGKWTDQEHISCKPVDCGYPFVPSNGNVVTLSKTTFKTIAKFYCDRDYLLEGASSATCENTGRWNYHGGQLSCKELKCPPMGQPANGRTYMTGRSVDARATFKCNTGYTLVGPQSITCKRKDDTGVWSDDPPSCTILQCVVPKAPKNGQVLGTQYTYGAKITFICNPGFHLRGTDRATCHTSGWDADTPTCQETICRDPGTPEHGSRDRETFGYAVTVTFTCDAGYTRAGSESITCNEKGSWSGRRPECEPVECRQLHPPRFGSRDGDQRTFPANVTFSCFPGYEMKGEANSRCQANGRWSSPEPVCTACSQGYYRDSSMKKCTKCPAHSTTFTGASTSVKQCTCDEGSSGPLGGPCRVVECEVLTPPRHGKFLPYNRKQDSECETECDAGYILSGGNRRRQCTKDGWTGKPAICTACPPNTYKMAAGSTFCQACPSNMVTKKGVPAQTRDACVCAAGFKSLGKGTPCLDINECMKNNGGCNQQCENTEGSYFCSCSIPGYQLETDAHTCTRNKTCPVLDQRPNNGFLNCRYTERTNGYICFLKCIKGYFFVSGENDYITCGAGSDFEWSHRRVNKTARIPACTREFFIDINLPLTLKYKANAGCALIPMSADDLQKKVKETVNTLPKCRKKCDIPHVSMKCSRTTISAKFNITIFNPHPNEIPLDWSSSCKRDSMISMVRDAFEVVKELKTIVETKKEMLEVAGDGMPYVDKAASLKSPGITTKPQMLCDHGRVLTSTRLCVPCDRGFYLPRRDLTTCLPCPKGTFQDKQGQVKCEPCYSGSTTQDAGSDHPTMCSVKASQVMAQKRGRYDVTEANAAAILDNPMWRL